jgi:hypothetical protein
VKFKDASVLLNSFKIVSIEKLSVCDNISSIVHNFVWIKVWGPYLVLTVLQNNVSYIADMHYATNRQVAVSIPDDVIGIFQ